MQWWPLGPPGVGGHVPAQGSVNWGSPLMAPAARPPDPAGVLQAWNGSARVAVQFLGVGSASSLRRAL